MSLWRRWNPPREGSSIFNPYYHLILIMDIEGRLVGFLGEVELIAALFEHGFTHKLGAVPVHKI